MPYTKKQQKAACAAYGIKKKGGKPTVMKNMSKEKLRSWCKADKLDKPKNESIAFKSAALQSPKAITMPTLKAVQSKQPKSHFEFRLDEALAPVLAGAARAAGPAIKSAAGAVAKKAGPALKNLAKKAAPHLKQAGKEAAIAGAKGLAKSVAGAKDIEDDMDANT